MPQRLCICSFLCLDHSGMPTPLIESYSVPHRYFSVSLESCHILLYISIPLTPRTPVKLASRKTIPGPSFFLETGFLNPSPGLILLSLRASFIPDSMRFPVVTGCQRTWEPQLPHQPVPFLTPAETPSLSCIFPSSELYLGAFHKPSTQWQHRVNAI